MSAAKIHLVDQDFLPKHSEKCNLLVRISDEKLSYSVLNQNDKQLKALVETAINPTLQGLKAAIAMEPLLQASYKKVKISIETSKFTFIPAEIYSEVDLASYAIFTYPLAKSTILVRSILSAGIKNISAIDEGLLDYLLAYFNDPLIVNQVNPLTEAALHLYPKSRQNRLFLQFNNSSFEALLIKTGQIEHYNLFKIETSEEFNYFLLAIINEFELSYANTDIVISGEITHDDDYCSKIQKYFSAISFADTSVLMRRTERFQHITAHQFFSLFSLNLCE